MSDQPHPASSKKLDSPSTHSIYPLPSTAAHTIKYLALPKPQPSQSPPDSHTRQESFSINPSTNINSQHAKLRAQISTIQTQIIETQSRLSSTLSQLQETLPASAPVASSTDLIHSLDSQLSPDQVTLHQAQNLVRKHIKLLHRYNETKDIALGLIGLIADKDGRRLGEVLADFGVEDGD